MGRGAQSPAAGGRASDDGDGETLGRIIIPQLSAEQRVNEENLRRELRVLESGRDDGRVNRPGPEETRLNEAQSRITARIFTGIASLNQFLAAQLAAAVADAGRAVPRRISAREQTEALKSRIGEAVGAWKQELASLNEQHERALLDLRHFMRSNGLNRAARYNESPMLFWAVVLLMAVVESALNGMLLRRVSEQGWLGGVSIAVLISAINIGLGFLAGLVGWRLLSHRSLAAKLGGVAVAALAHGVAIAWNIYVAHFREAVEAAVEADAGGSMTQAASEALRLTFAHGVLGLTTFYSWALLLLGLGIHLGAALHSWNDLYDHHWFYAQQDRRYRQARGAYEAGVANLREDATAAAKEVLDRNERLASGAAQAKARIAEAIGEAEQRTAEVRDSEAEWVRRGNGLLKSYREENSHVRRAQAPAYWNSYPTAHQYRKAGRSGADDASPDADVFAAEDAAARALEQLRVLAQQAEQISAANAEAFAHIRAAYAAQMKTLDDELAVHETDIVNRAKDALKDIGRRDELVEPRGAPHAA